MTDRKLILINGPPSSGKDLSAIILRNMLFAKRAAGSLVPFRPAILKFADPLKAAVHQLYNLPYGCAHYEKEFGNDWKNTPQVEFFGNTPRSEYIAMSEGYAKKRHDDTFFGRIAARRISLDKQNNVFIFADSGFAAEAVPVISLVGLSNVLLIELERTDCSFSNDSRGYVADVLNSAFAGKLNYVRLPNNGDQALLTILLRGLMYKYLNLERQE